MKRFRQEVTTEDKQQPSMIVLRWITFFPGALLASWITWFLSVLVNRLTMGMQGVDPDSFLSRVFIEFNSHALMSAAFVYAGAKIAPSNRKLVAYVLAGFGLVTSGFLVLPALALPNYWAIWATIGLILGFAAAGYAVSAGETDL